MSLRNVFFYSLCAATWFLVLPVLVVGGAVTLLSYAVLTEISGLVGTTSRPMDRVAAREAARRVCAGH